MGPIPQICDSDQEGICRSARHGTTERAAGKICREGFKLSKDRSYLGDGVYFFCGEFATELAREHAEITHRRARQMLTILQAKIASDSCLDFTDHRCIRLLRKTATKLKDMGYKASDAAVINLLANEISPEIDVVYALQPEKVFGGSIYATDLLPVLCVRNTTCISEVSALEMWMPKPR